MHNSFKSLIFDSILPAVLCTCQLADMNASVIKGIQCHCLDVLLWEATFSQVCYLYGMISFMKLHIWFKAQQTFSVYFNKLNSFCTSKLSFLATQPVNVHGCALVKDMIKWHTFRETLTKKIKDFTQ